jgi:membrane protease YdiL (CAAX protease family)
MTESTRAGNDRSVVRQVFLGPNGIRAGWRLLIFIALFAALSFAVGIAFARSGFGASRGDGILSQFGPVQSLIGEGVPFLVTLLATFIMAKIEKRRLGDYGLPARNAFRGKFWEGMIWGFAALTALLTTLRLTGNFYFGTLALHGREVITYGAIWAVAFLFVGFFEEFLLRGYALFTLTTGIGFWSSAILLSILFGAGHLNNPGEARVGVLSVVGFGLVLCLMLRRTGDLWLAVGFHCAFDWSETFFYGTPDSGIPAVGHLLNSSFQGSKWMTGGSVGPEGSLMCFVMLAALAAVISWRFPNARYPNAAAVGYARGARLED